MQCKPTQYAVARGAYVEKANSNCMWWLRTPGLFQDFATYVTTEGKGDMYGYNVDYTDLAVRPAMWINLNA